MTTPEDPYQKDASLSSGRHCSAPELMVVPDGKHGAPQTSASHTEDSTDGTIQSHRFFEGLLYVLPPSILVWLLITWLISLF